METFIRNEISRVALPPSDRRGHVFHYDLSHCEITMLDDWIFHETDVLSVTLTHDGPTQLCIAAIGFGSVEIITALYEAWKESHSLEMIKMIGIVPKKKPKKIEGFEVLDLEYFSPAWIPLTQLSDNRVLGTSVFASVNRISMCLKVLCRATRLGDIKACDADHVEKILLEEDQFFGSRLWL